MYAEERRNEILDYLDKHGRVDIMQLSKKLDASRETIRRDLKDLEAQGLLVKTHGGAIANRNNSIWSNIPFIHRQATNEAGKNAVAMFAAHRINDSDNVFLDNSSTVSNIIKYLDKSMRLTILTNSLHTLVEIAKLNVPSWTVLAMGGQLNAGTLSTSGYLTARNLSQFKPTKAIMSCHGIDSALEVTDGNLNDAETKQCVLAQARESFLLVDKEKLGLSGVVTVAGITTFDYVVTEESGDELFITRMKQVGANVMLAKPV